MFGAWTAYWLPPRRRGKCCCCDAYGPGNSRLVPEAIAHHPPGYGQRDLHALRAASLELWLQLFAETDTRSLFQPTGVLWLHENKTHIAKHIVDTPARRGALKSWTVTRIGDRFPQRSRQATWEFRTGCGMCGATRCARVVSQARAIGVDYCKARVTSDTRTTQLLSCLHVVHAAENVSRTARELIQVTRQESSFSAFRQVMSVLDHHGCRCGSIQRSGLRHSESMAADSRSRIGRARAGSKIRFGRIALFRRRA